MQAHVDYTEVAPVPHQLTLQFINNFIVNTTQFLNKFALTCDDKLRDVHNRIQRLEITMNILDAKLNSIEGLEDVRAAETSVQSQASADGAPPPPPPPPGSSQPIQHSQNNQEQVDEVAESSGGLKLKDDPRYSKYFKMLNYGIPLAQVQNKMMMEGVDPSILEYAFELIIQIL